MRIDQTSPNLTDREVTLAQSAEPVLQDTELPGRVQTLWSKLYGDQYGLSLDVTESAEGASEADTIDLALQLQKNGEDLAEVHRLTAQVFDAGFEQDSSEFTLDGGGNEDSANNSSGLVFDTDADGSVTIQVTDKVGSRDVSCYVKFIDFSTGQPLGHTKLTFAS